MGVTAGQARHNSSNVGGVTAGQARHNSSNVGGVTAGQVGHNSSIFNYIVISFSHTTIGFDISLRARRGDDWTTSDLYVKYRIRLLYVSYKRN